MESNPLAYAVSRASVTLPVPCEGCRGAIAVSIKGTWEMAKKIEIGIAAGLFVVAIGYGVAFIRVPSLDRSTAARSAVQAEPLSQDAIESISRFLRSSLEPDPSRYSADGLPPMSELMMEDGPTLIAEFDLIDGQIGRSISLIEAARRVKGDTIAVLAAIAKKIYDGEVAKSVEHGYIQQHLHPKYFNEHYAAPDSRSDR